MLLGNHAGVEFNNRTRRHQHVQVLAITLLLGAGPVLGQPAPPKPELQARIDEAARMLEADPRLKRFSPQKLKEVVEFVVGNSLFVLAHEMGHTAIGEMGLPVLGREEDAADTFATLTGLKVGTAFAERVLTESAKGWFLSDRRSQKRGEKLSFYDEHGLDKQRAYYIVCLMVGSDPDKFKALADETGLPEERQGTCQGDDSNASWSWDKVLQPHRRATDQPKTKIDASYLKGKDNLDIYAQAFRRIRILDIVAEYAADRFVWRAPFKLEMRACGESNAHWDQSAREIFFCYELADEFAHLYLDYGDELKPSTGKRKP